MEDLIKQQQLAAASGGSSGGGGGNTNRKKDDNGGISMDYDGLFAAAKESRNPQSYIANMYKQFGFSSNSGLWSDYQNWAENQTAENSIDMKSIIDLGFGPLNAEGLDQLVRSGQVEEYEENGKTRFRLAGTGKSGAPVRAGW